MSSLFKKKVLRSGSLFDLTKVDEEGKPQEDKVGKLRRVFTTIRKKRKSPNYALNTVLKEPLRVVHSVPLTFGICVFSNTLHVPDANYLSPSTDLAARRGVFSRRHYGSVELLVSCDADGAVQSMGRFRVESGDRIEKDELYHSPSTPVLENPEYQTRWYFKYFLGKLHQNYVGADADKNPFFLSVVLTDANNHNVHQYRAILWRKKGTQKISLPYNQHKPLTVKSILSCFSSTDKIEKGPKEITNPDIQKDLLLLEEQEGSVNFKFGILYAKVRQTTDDEMFSNEQGSEAFDEFIQLLGDKVTLNGWDKFRGGLDVKSDTTGNESAYTIYEGHEIMFHISTLLPYSKDNPQQVERKRHIGNDIVNIVFQDSEGNEPPTFKPSMIKSQFTHIFALVTFEKESNSYRLAVYSEESVPLFGPPLPSPPVFSNHQEFREFLLVKLINGEKAAFNTPTFSQKRQRTLEMLIKDLYDEHMAETSKTVLNRRAFSDVLPDSPKGSRRKEEARQAEFVRIGQALKLDTIVKGDAPTSLATTSLFKREPWEPQCLYPDFSHEIFCGDSWGENRLILATEVGTCVIEEGLSPRPIFDKSVVIKQLSVVEAHGILLFRLDKGKDSKIHVFRLSDFEGVYNEQIVRAKTECKEYKLDRTKGCHLYALSRPAGSHLRMVVAISKKLLLMQWKHSAAWTAWCPTSDTDTVEGFQFIRELQAGDVPSIITLIDGGKGDNQICIGYRHQFDLINEKNGDTLRLFLPEGNKVNLVSALDIYEDDEAELLLFFNNVCHFQKLCEESSAEFDFSWNSVPQAIVCAFPYIMAFTPDSIEIRLIINGNLVHTMIMPQLSLITSKNDIYFASTAPEFYPSPRDRHKLEKEKDHFNLSPPSSPPAKNWSTHNEQISISASSNCKPLRIYKISISCLTGQIGTERPLPDTSISQQQSTITPLINISDESKTTAVSNVLELSNESSSQETTLVRTRFTSKTSKERNISSSSDSGIHQSIGSIGSSPPASPFQFSESCEDEAIDVK